MLKAFHNFGNDLFFHILNKKIDNRDPQRAPMQWDSNENAGFAPAGAEPWLPGERKEKKQLIDTSKLGKVFCAVNSNYPDLNVELQSEDSSSHLAIYKALVALRYQA